jgi:glycosyltransferase involved in cell wall biosynthesis
MTKKVLLNADQIISVSHALKTAAEGIATGLSGKIKVVYNGCDLDNFTYNKKERQRRRAELGISEQGRAIIFIGNLIKTKGIYDLIAAFIKLSSTHHNLNLIIIGNGPEYSTIKNIISSSNHSEKKIHLLGNKPHNEVSHWLSASDIFVLPTYYEGLPNAVLEAMACGLPVIATKVGGIPEVIEEGRNGILIDKKDVESLIRAIVYLLKNQALAKNMGTQGRKMFESRFSWQKNAQKVIEIYKEVLFEKS